MFANLTLRKKIILVIIMTGVFILIFSSILWGYYDWKHLRTEMIEDLNLTTQELARGITLVVKKDDRPKIISGLSSLKDNPGIISAWVVNKDGLAIAGYLNFSGYAKEHPELLNANHVKKEIDTINAARKRVIFFNKSLGVTVPIVTNNEYYGNLYVFSSTAKLYDRVLGHIEKGIFVLLCSVLFSIFLAFRMHKVISRPIIELAKTMDEIANNKDYSIRVKQASRKDEVGELIKIFNEMISNIEKHTMLQKQSEENIRRLAYFDTLTKLPNRRLFQEYLNLIIRHSAKEKLSFNLMFIDLNKFKQINDSLGHDKGDLLLQTVATRLRESIQTMGHFDNLSTENTDSNFSQSQMAARLGGDEFTIILPNSTKAEAEAVAIRVIERCKQAVDLGGNIIYPAMSIGMATYPEDGKHEDALVKAADLAMYFTKQHRKGNYTFYHPKLQDEFSSQYQLEHDLKEAIKQRQFTLLYQPVVNIETNKIVGCEALIRWQHPTLDVSTSEFISLAEEIGLINKIGNFTLDESCRQIQQLNASGYKNIFVIVNISPKYIEDPIIVSELKEVLNKYNIDPKQLVLEITENVFLKNTKQILDTINEIKKIGCSFSIDDFGVGYSSLSYLATLPLSYLKIAGNFVQRITDDENYRKIIIAVLNLARAFDFQPIAEGVEHRSQLQAIRAINCNYCQGYFLYRPMPMSDLIQLLK